MYIPTLTPGRSNPADLPSGGLTALELSTNRLWKEGPEWLKQGTDPLHSRPSADSMPEVCAQELKVTTKSLSLVSADSRNTNEDLMTCQNFSTYSRLLSVTAQVLKAVKRFKIGKSRIPDDTTTITPERLAEAETLWIIIVQQQFNNKKNFQYQQGNLDSSRITEGYGSVEEGLQMRTCLMLLSTPQNSPTYYSDCKGGTRMCLSQWGQGNPIRDKMQILDFQRMKPD